MQRTLGLISGLIAFPFSGYIAKLHPSSLALKVEPGEVGRSDLFIFAWNSFPCCVSFGGHMLEMAVSRMRGGWALNHHEEGCPLNT